ncbi:MAG: MFS transporter [Sphingobacteriales bacterium]|nr:MAG: MFS transporter [Sphingobacteriales bacterium]
MDSLDSLILDNDELPHRRRNEFLIVLLLSFITYICTVDSMLMMPLMNIVMDTYQIGAKTSTIIISIYSFTAFIAGILSSGFMDLYDRKKLLLITFIGFTIGTGLCSYGTTFYLMIIYRGFTGIFGGIIGGVAMSIISDLIPFQRRATAISIISLSFAMAAITGIPFGIYLSQNFNLFLPFKILTIISILTIFAIIVWIPPVKKHLQEKRKKKFSLKHITQVFLDNNQLLSLILAFLLVFSHQVVIVFVVPYFENNIGFSQKWIPVMYLIGGIVTVITSPIIGKMSDKIGNKTTFIILLFLSFIPIILTTHIQKATIPIVIMICATFFIFAAGRMIPAYTIMSGAMTKEMRGAFMSTRSAFLELGTFVATTISGFIVTIDKTTGIVSNYKTVGYISVMAGLICLLIVLRIRIVCKD